MDHRNGRNSLEQVIIVKHILSAGFALHVQSIYETAKITLPRREVISPVVHGIENLPSASSTSRPLLFVGNHARIGLYDMPYLIIELYLRGIKVLLSNRSSSYA